MRLLGRLLPRHADNRFVGLRPALWLFGLLIFLKLVIGLNSIFDTASVASGADGIPLDSFGPTAARQVLILFALIALGHVFLALIVNYGLLTLLALGLLVSSIPAPDKRARAAGMEDVE